MFVRSRVKHMRQKTEQIAKAIRSDLQKVADGHPLKQKFLATYEGMPWLRRFLTEGQASVDGPPPDGPATDAVEPLNETLSSPNAEGRVDPQGQRQGHWYWYWQGPGVHR
jgi:hypothetical protein